MRLKIYYLDDEVDLLELFQDTFASEGVEITTFSDPQAAVEAINRVRPDLIFLDYRLPNTTGDKIALSLDPSIPKALISGDIYIKCVANFEAKFEKPFVVHEIRQFIDPINAKKKAA